MTTTDLGSLSAAEKRALLAERLRQKKQRREFPASFSQQRLWFLEQLSPGSAAYNIPGAVRILGPLDLEALAALLQRDHPPARGAAHHVHRVDGEPGSWSTPLRAGVAAGRLRPPARTARGEARPRRLAREEARRPFDLAGGPLLRARLLRLGPDEHVAAADACTTSSADGWSMGVSSPSSVALYAAFAPGASRPLPELPVQYADYAVWQRQRLRRATCWSGSSTTGREQLAGAPAPLDAADRPAAPAGAELPRRPSRRFAARPRRLSPAAAR